MTREIKFRAWGKRKQGDNIMYSPATLQQWIESIWSKPEDFVWMQFAGLKDRLGKEIYEGDIVRVGNMANGDTTFIKEVSFENGHFHVAPVGLAHRCDLLGYIRGEVIGNIYENPELLTK